MSREPRQPDHRSRPAGLVVAEAAAARASALRWRPLGPQRLKGIADPVELFARDGS